MIIVKIMGGLGNQLFQYAVGYSLAVERKMELKLDLNFYNDNKYTGVFRLDKYKIEILEVEEKDLNRLTTIRTPTKFEIFFYENRISKRLNRRSHLRQWGRKSFNEVLKNWNGKELLLDGWLQKPELFHDKRKLICEKYIPSVSIPQSIQKTVSEINGKNSVALHFRRGDMYNNPSFRKLDTEYYTSAIAEIKSRINNPFFFVFTDDITIDTTCLNLGQEMRLVSTESTLPGAFSNFNDMWELYLMSKCNHFVIANSTFSWWGAYLSGSNDKIVIAPKVWYNINNLQKQMDSDKFLLDDWVKI